jgi:hypothetical protein
VGYADDQTGILFGSMLTYQKIALEVYYMVLQTQLRLKLHFGVLEGHIPPLMIGV